MKEANEHPEIANASKLNELVTKYNIKSSKTHGAGSGSLIGGDGGLHDFIWRLPREKLNNWALATEAYHREVNNLHLLGGLHDTISSLSNDQVIAYILKEVKEHPEIAGADKLDGLVARLLNPPTTLPLPEAAGGVHDYIWRLPREKINLWALATEQYHREINNLHLLGGLDDYITSLSDKQVVEYILKEIKEHPELNSDKKLDELVTKYGIKSPVAH